MEDSLTQGTAEWHQARCGSLGASRVHEVLTRTKTGWGASRANVAAALICERLTGISQDTYTNAAMQHGIDTEPQARAAYVFLQDAAVTQVGLIRHPTIAGAHASPDGLVGDDGLLEIKCPSSATHIETLISETIDGKYVTQMLWQMACTGRAYCDFVSFDPRLPPEMQLWIRRVPRDDAKIAEIEKEVRVFLAELDAKVAALQARYVTKVAA